VIEDACSTGELLRALDLEPVREGALERLAVVVGMRAGLLAHQEGRDTRIVAGRELDHQRRPELGEPGEELRHRHVAADRHVVQHSEAERQLGTAAGLERLPLQPVPAECGRRIGDVGDERQDRRLSFGRQRAVEAIDNGAVAVECDDVACVLGGDARMPSLVAAHVPDQIPLAGVHDLAHKRLLARGIRLVVRRRRAVARPLGRAGLPLESAHELLEPLHVGDD
jgi:hypothetical protein